MTESEQTKRLVKTAATMRRLSSDGRTIAELIELSRRQDATDAKVAAIEAGSGTAMCSACGHLLNPDCGAMRAVRAWLCSFEPPHEIKIGTVGWALYLWAEPIPSDTAGAAP